MREGRYYQARVDSDKLQSIEHIIRELARKLRSIGVTLIALNALLSA